MSTDYIKQLHRKLEEVVADEDNGLMARTERLEKAVDLLTQTLAEVVSRLEKVEQARIPCSPGDVLALTPVFTETMRAVVRELSIEVLGGLKK